MLRGGEEGFDDDASVSYTSNRREKVDISFNGVTERRGDSDDYIGCIVGTVRRSKEVNSRSVPRFEIRDPPNLVALAKWIFKYI
jgi:hypothetical protein